MAYNYAKSIKWNSMLFCIFHTHPDSEQDVKSKLHRVITNTQCFFHKTAKRSSSKFKTMLPKTLTPCKQLKKVFVTFSKRAYLKIYSNMTALTTAHETTTTAATWLLKLSQSSQHTTTAPEQFSPLDTPSKRDEEGSDPNPANDKIVGVSDIRNERF